MDTNASMTFGELLIRLAEAVDVSEYGSGTDNRPTVPTDPQTLDRLKRAINDGAMELARAIHPKTGKAVRWSWLQPVLALTLASAADSALNIQADAKRYRLPPGVVSAPRGRVSWRDPSDSYGGPIRVASYSRLVEMADRSPSQTGSPMYVAVTPWMGASTNARPGLELMVFPAPDMDYTIRARFTVQVLPLMEVSDRGVWGAMHDLTVLDLAIAAWHRGTAQYESFRGIAEQAVVRSIEQDALVWETSADREEPDVFVRPVTVSFGGSQILP